MKLNEIAKYNSRVIKWNVTFLKRRGFAKTKIGPLVYTTVRVNIQRITKY